MPAETLMQALGRGKGAEYMAHMQGHAKRMLAAYEKVVAKAEADPKSGAAERLKQYDATLERYARELEAWKVLQPSKEEEN